MGSNELVVSRGRTDARLGSFAVGQVDDVVSCILNPEARVARRVSSRGGDDRHVWPEGGGVGPARRCGVTKNYEVNNGVDAIDFDIHVLEETGVEALRSRLAVGVDSSACPDDILEFCSHSRIEDRPREPGRGLKDSGRSHDEVAIAMERGVDGERPGMG